MYKKLLYITLCSILLFSMLIEPIKLFSVESSEIEKERASDYILVELKEDLNTANFIIKEDTVLYLKELLDTHLLFIGDQEQEVDPAQFTVIKEMMENSPEFYLEEDFKKKELKSFPKGSTFVNDNNETVIRTEVEIKEIPIYLDENTDTSEEPKKGIFIGNRLFPLNEENLAEEEDITKEVPITDENENNESNKDEEGDGEAKEDEHEDLTGEDTVSEEESSEKSDLAEENGHEKKSSANNESESNVEEKSSEEEIESNEQNSNQQSEDKKQESEQQLETNTAFTTSSSRLAKNIDPWANSNVTYFEVVSDNLTVYDNRTGNLVEIGKLEKGQSYPIASNYGSWHRIQFGSYFGYVYKDGTIPSTANSIKNINKSYESQSRTVTAHKDTTGYDNSSGKLVEMGELAKGARIAIASDYGSWWRVIFADRVGYINKSNVEVDFLPTDNYFRVTEHNLPVYDNRSGKLVQKGTLTEGQVYPIVSSYGSWWRIQFNDYYGYVYKEGTEYATNNLKNINTNYSHSSRTIEPLSDVNIYDNSSGSLVEYGTLKQGVNYHVVSDYGNWWRIIYADRVGYVSKSNVKASFISGDKYFSALSNSSIYYSNNGNLTKVGEIIKDQVYKIGRSYGKKWWEISFNGNKAYVAKSSTSPEAKPKLDNLNTKYKNSNKTVKTLNKTTVYDNSTGPLIAIGKIEPNIMYKVVSDYGNWWRILFNDQVGYISKSSADNQITERTNYNLSFSRMVDIQMTATPKANGAGTINATRDQVSYYLNPSNFEQGTSNYFQFLLLDEPSNVNKNEINNKFLQTYSQAGSLQGQGAAFIEAANQYGINELYLIAHTLHETGNGKSTLASGVSRWTKMKPESCTPVRDSKGDPVIIDISPKKVYNMYGVAAYDDCATDAAAQYAYDKDWTTPDKAVVGGASFIKNGYIERGQNTLYKMRWDPAFAAENNRFGRQYATHVAWADIQAKSIASMYSQISGYYLPFEVPRYINQPSGGSELYKVNVSNTLRVRSQPSTNSRSVGILYNNDIVTVLTNNNNQIISQTNDGYTWYKILYNGTERWIASEFIQKAS